MIPAPLKRGPLPGERLNAEPRGRGSLATPGGAHPGSTARLLRPHPDRISAPTRRECGRQAGRGLGTTAICAKRVMPERVIPRPNLDVLARERERVGLGLSDPCVAPCMTVFSPVIRRGFSFAERIPALGNCPAAEVQRPSFRKLAK